MRDYSNIFLSNYCPYTLLFDIVPDFINILEQIHSSIIIETLLSNVSNARKIILIQQKFADIRDKKIWKYLAYEIIMCLEMPYGVSIIKTKESLNCVQTVTCKA